VAKKFKMKHLIFIVALLISIYAFAEKKYHKFYYENGKIKAEGWYQNNKKVDYWKFYYNNGNIEKEGHFSNDQPVNYWYFYTENGTKKIEGHFVKGQKTNWWLFYDDMEKLNHKCQLKNNQKNGYCLMYKNEKIVSATKYKAGKKIKTWTNFKAFKSENNLFDLQ
jgi:antitoxin component YwqK of YwqJK toxin-antitoxin module